MSTENYQPSLNPQDDEISILDLTLQIVRNAKSILKITLYFLLVGLIIAIIKPSKYTATSIVVNEAINLEEMSLSGGLGALRKFGINLGPTTEGLTLEAYPRIITSREVLYKVAKDTFYFSDLDTTLRLVDYINYKDFIFYLKKYTIKLHRTIYRYFFPKKIFVYPGDMGNNEHILLVNEAEDEAIKTLSEDYVSAESDIETGLISISITTFDPNLSAAINAALLEKFRIKMQQIYDQKASENLKFIRDRFLEAEQALRASEEKVVKFLEENSDPNTIALQTELERLQRNVSFKAEVYSELQSQLTQTEIELKRKEPVIRIMERPSPPREPRGPGKGTIIILFLFLGFILSLIKVISSLFIKQYMQNNDKTGEKSRAIISYINELRYLIAAKLRLK